MTNEVSPNMIKREMCKHPRLMFITINPNKGLDDTLRVCKVSKWSDYLRKISSDFIIVRERKNGYHFHALFSLKKGAKIKYIKNIHFRLDAVSGESNYAEDTTYQDMCEDIADTGGTEDDVKEAYAEYKEDKKVITKIITEKSKTKKEENVSRIINYLFKEGPALNLVDLIYMKQSKLQFIQPTVKPDVAKQPLACSRSAETSGSKASGCFQDILDLNLYT